MECSSPNYSRPPVVETIFGVQFEPMPKFRNAHLGAFWKTLPAGEWPNVTDAPPLQPQVERFGDSEGWGRAGLHLMISRDPTARIQIKNGSGNRMIQVQNGRFHFNWLGQSGEADYPRYLKLRDEFVWALRGFRDFANDEGLGPLISNQWEVTYLNHMPIGTVWRTPGDWGFFKPLAAVPTVEGLVEGESFGGEWHFVIPGQQGRLHVQWQHILRTEPQREELIRLTLTARGPLGADSTLDDVLQRLNLGHHTVVWSFRKLMNESANEYWGLTDAGD